MRRIGLAGLPGLQRTGVPAPAPGIRTTLAPAADTPGRLPSVASFVGGCSGSGMNEPSMTRKAAAPGRHVNNRWSLTRSRDPRKGRPSLRRRMLLRVLGPSYQLVFSVLMTVLIETGFPESRASSALRTPAHPASRRGPRACRRTRHEAWPHRRGVRRAPLLRAVGEAF